MNIGICLSHRHHDMEEVFRSAAENGFHHGQLLSWDPALWTESEAARIVEYSQRYDVTITAFWCGWVGPKAWNFTEGPETLGLVPETYRFTRLQNLLDGAAFAHRINVKDVVTHMGFMPENMTDPKWPGVVATVRALAETLKANGQNLLFETGQETPVVLLRLFEQIGTDNLFVNLDPANLVMYGKANPVDALDVFGKYVRGVHAKDGCYPTSGRELGCEVRIGSGKVDFHALLKGLQQYGYNGSLTIEREISGAEQLQDIMHARRYLQSMLDDLEAEKKESASEKTIRVGMVGMGGISRVHVDAWLKVPEAAVVCVCDIRPEMAQAAAERTGAIPYDDFDAMLDSEQFDILDICLPTYLHAEFSIKALNRGIHVLCEKPISLKKEDIAKVYSAAEKNCKNFMVAQVLRFWPEYILLREAIQTGKYGKLLSGHMGRLGNTPAWTWDDWMRDPERSGLVPFDLHIHDLDFMVYTLGSPDNVVCHRVADSTQDYLNAIYEYKNYFISTEASWYNCNYEFAADYRFQFEHAVLSYSQGKLTIYHDDLTTETVNATGTGIDPEHLTGNDAYYNEIRYFVDCVLSGAPCDRVKSDELYTVMQLIEKLNSKT